MAPKKLPAYFTKRKDGRLVARYNDKAGTRHEIIQRKEENYDSFYARYLETSYKAMHAPAIEKAITLDDALKEYIKSKRNLRVTTKRGYNRHAIDVGTILGKRKIASLKAGDFDELFEYFMNERHMAPSTVGGIKAFMNGVFDYAVKRHWVEKNIISDVNPIGGASIRDEGLSEEEQAIFLEEMKNTSYGDLSAVLLFTGLRIGEALGLCWDCVDMESGFISVRRTLTYSTETGIPKGKFVFKNEENVKTKNGYRNIPLSEDALEIFKRLWEERKRDTQRVIDDDFGDLVFVTKKGTPIHHQNISAAMKATSLRIRENGYKEMPMVHPHMLRHTFATNCAQANMNGKALTVIMGHSKYSFTMDHYVHSDTEYLKSELSKVKAIVPRGVNLDGEGQ